MARDVCHASAMDEQITGGNIWAAQSQIVLDQSGVSGSSLSRWFCSSVGRLWTIAALLAQVVLGDMPSPLAMKALPQMHRFPIIFSLIMSLIPPWTFAAFTSFTAINTTTFATLLCKEQSFWSEPILSLDCSFSFHELGDGLIWRGGHHGVFVHHELQEGLALVVPWDPVKEVEDVFLLTHLGHCLCRVRIDIIRVSGWWCCQSYAEIVILDFPIDPQCIVVDISAVP